MSQLVFRPAEETDDDGIVALARRCPQEGMITFLFNRGPRFNTINRLLDPEASHFVACDRGCIVGVVGVIHFQAQVFGRTRKIAYILDLLLDSRYRKDTTAFRLIRPVVQQLHHSDADMVLLNFLKDNRHPLVFTEGRAGFPAATHLGDNTFFSMLRKFRGISVKSEMHAFARDPQLAEQLGQVDLPVMFNLALLQ